jgi:hypothetical protein
MDGEPKEDGVKTAAEIMAACPTIYPTPPLGGFWCPPGWLPLVAGLSLAIEALARDMPDPPRVAQVKEKFGGLRFYMSHGHDDIFALIDTAEAASFHVCQECGSPGQLRPGSWLKTLCDAHAAKRG